MKLKELRSKDLGELKKMLTDAKADAVKLSLERQVKKDKNVKTLSNKRREIAVLSGLVSAKAIREAK